MQCAHPEKVASTTPIVITDCIASGLTFVFEVPSNRPFYGWVGLSHSTREIMLTRPGLKPTHPSVASTMLVATEKLDPDVDSAIMTMLAEKHVYALFGDR